MELFLAGIYAEIYRLVLFESLLKLETIGRILWTFSAVSVFKKG